ncbi:MAG: AAA family ATPase, partial [Gemmatimonadota bacterium]|nr:AAA family ATPase [Gemmatimonadota bacterium]
MKLTKVRITEFRSIQDSTEFEIGDITCLVGKNEAGKTALLKALYCLNPIIESDGNFDATSDYPRRDLIDYESQVDNEERDPAQVVQATYELGPEDIAAVEKVFGSECLQDKAISLTLKKGYSNELTFNELSVDSEAALKHLVMTSDLSTTLSSQLLAQTTTEAMVEILQNIEEPTASSENLMSSLQKISGQEFSHVVFYQILYPRIPKFLYFDEYYQMKGQDNLDELRQREATNTLAEADYPLLGLIDLAGLNIDLITDPRRTIALKARLEAAASQLTDKALKYWSLNSTCKCNLLDSWHRNG